MNFNYLKLRNKNFIVDSAFRIFRPASDSPEIRRRWVDYLFESHDIEWMIRCIKNNENPDGQKNSIVINFDKSFFGEISVIDKNIIFYADAKRKLEVRVENHSELIWKTAPEDSLHASYHWYNRDGTLYQFDGLRSPIKKPIPATEPLDFEISVASPKYPGVYQLEVTMVLEGYFWLEEKDLKTWRKTIEVFEFGGQGMSRQARDHYERLNNISDSRRL